MKNNALVMAILFGISLFLFIVVLASFRYDRENKRKKRINPNDWLFSEFYLKVYSAFFGIQDPDEVAIKIGINIEKYYQSCRLVRVEPNTKKLIINHIYAFGILIFSLFMSLIWSFLAFPTGGAVAIYLVYFEQNKLNKKAEEMRIQISNELPRFLDLLETELQIGIPVENALSILCMKFDSLISKEFMEALNSMKLGVGGWQKALEDVATKYEVETLSNFVLDITTSYNKGVSVADAVSRKARDIKDTHLLNIKERAGKTTNTCLIPIAIFQFLPMLAYILMPVMKQVSIGF